MKKLICIIILVTAGIYHNAQAALLCNQANPTPGWIVYGSLNGGNPDTDGVRASAVVGNDFILVGRFTQTYQYGQKPSSGFSRTGFLILDKNTGNPSIHDFDPQVNGSIEAIDCDGNDCIVAGGFNRFKGASVNQIAKFNLITGELDQNFRAPELYQGSYFNILYRNGVVYAAGSIQTFRLPSGQFISRSGMVAFNSEGTITSWNPSASHEVYRLRMSPKGTIFASGDFVSVGGNPRQGFAEIKPDGTITNFNPAPSPNESGVTGRDTAFIGKQIILAGEFITMSGHNHHGLAAVFYDGSDTGWNPQTNFLFAGQALAVTSSSVYVSFASSDNRVGGQIRRGLAEVDLTNGNATAFQADVTLSPLSSYPSGVRDIHITQNSTTKSCRQVNVTGNFIGISGQPFTHIARLQLQ